MLFETRELFPLLLIRQMTASLAQICLSPSIYFDTHGFHQLLFASRQKETSGGEFHFKMPLFLRLLSQAGLPTVPPQGDTLQVPTMAFPAPPHMPLAQGEERG